MTATCACTAERTTATRGLVDGDRVVKALPVVGVAVCAVRVESALPLRWVGV